MLFLSCFPQNSESQNWLERNNAINLETPSANRLLKNESFIFVQIDGKRNVSKSTAQYTRQRHIENGCLRFTKCNERLQNNSVTKGR